MNLVTKSNNDYIEPIPHDNNINSIISDFSVKEEKVVVWDADSIIYTTLYMGKNPETGELNPPYTENDLEFLYGKLDEYMLKILNNIENYFIIKSLYIFIRGKDNFRKKLYPEYKFNRPKKDPLSVYLYDYMKEKYQAVESHGYEAEDYCATIAWKLGKDCIIAYVDHDLEEISGAILYNYQKDKFIQLSEKEAIYNKYKKLNIGENGDFANFTPSYAEKSFERDFHIDMTVEEYEAQTLETFIWCWSDKLKVKGKKIQRFPNESLAKEKLELAKQIIWLQNVENK
jgi:hypothetical protein